ncbi:uncharacterized protein LOC118194067 [Stegodyphus dumicola]|uniref:uncharacterized protein LOC118194067 n=1 Tax=Stegodyphus dumicola TaxID=202533 RepID=UPI0015B1B413|nr:uncharacterized protein LOC118194067 [Stegodyphus dumicola]
MKTWKKIFDLKSLGIACNENFKDDEVLREFESSIKMVNSRYEVSLPWNENVEFLSDNYAIAEERFKKLVNKFNRNPFFLNQYKEIISKHVAEGIAEKVDSSMSESKSKVYYMPHQAVIREDQLTTKMRIVFDASSSVINSVFLFDYLNPDPNLTSDLLALFLQFRLNRVTLTADIESAFLQMALAPEDRDAVRFLWIKDDTNMEPEKLRMTRVSFGLRSSTFLLNATLKHHVSEYEKDYPIAFQIISNKLYVDDLIHSLQDEGTAFKVHRQGKFVLGGAGFTMRKWRTNTLLQDRFNEKTAFDNSFCKVLGYCWNSLEKCISIDNEMLLNTKNAYEFKSSKRSVIRTAGKVFDPTGLISPFTIRTKMILQEIWKRRLK